MNKKNIIKIGLFVIVICIFGFSLNKAQKKELRGAEIYTFKNHQYMVIVWGGSVSCNHYIDCAQCDSVKNELIIKK